MNFTEYNVLKNQFEKYESKKITKRLINEIKYVKLFLLSSIVLMILLVVTLIFFKNKYINTTIFTLYLLLLFNFYFLMSNNKFHQLSAPQRQFYILFLMLDHLKTNYESNKHKLWSLSSAYCRELYKVESLHKEYSLFNISVEEQTLFKLREAFNHKIKGNILNGKSNNEIIEIITSIISINFIRNQYNHEESTSKNINDIKDFLCFIESKLSNLDDLPAKVDILKFDWIANKIKNGNQKLMIILISTFFMVLFYVITSYFNKERISMGTLIQILIGTPLFVQLLISLVKNEKSQ